MNNTSKYVLEFNSVSKSYPGNPPVEALKSIDLKLERGAFAAVVGSSGSGKTTMLNIASGLDRPSTGEVVIAGAQISTLKRSEMNRFRSQHIGFVFQSYNLFPVLTAVENVEFTCLIRGDHPAKARAAAQQALRDVGLDGKERSIPSQLSGGQQQRVAVARALAMQPDIIFADEPTANLDSKTADSLISLFEQLNREKGVTFLFSTHDRELISRVRLVLQMKDGQLTGPQP